MKTRIKKEDKEGWQHEEDNEKQEGQEFDQKLSQLKH